MLVLTHEGPAYRSKTLTGSEAQALAARHRTSPAFTAVRVLEDLRARSTSRKYLVLCALANAESRAAKLALLQDERRLRAEEEGPGYTWLPTEDERTWQLLSGTGSLYTVNPAERSCTCRDGAVCASNGIHCKHVLALEARLGLFLNWDYVRRVQQFLAALGAPQPASLPVTAPVDPPAAAVEIPAPTPAEAPPLSDEELAALQETNRRQLEEMGQRFQAHAAAGLCKPARPAPSQPAPHPQAVAPQTAPRKARSRSRSTTAPAAAAP